MMRSPQSVPWPAGRSRRDASFREQGKILLRMLLLLGFVAFLGLLYVVRNPLLRAAGEFWVVSDDLQQSDAIFILSPDNYRGDRAAKAAELYRQRWAPRIVVSDQLMRPYAGYGELMKHDLRQFGIPENAILRATHQGRNTREEAAILSQFASGRGWKRVIIVTSNFHTRRARYICDRTFPPGVDVRVIAAPDYEYDPDHWWESRLGIKIFFSETAGSMVALWEMRHNHPPS